MWFEVCSIILIGVVEVCWVSKLGMLPVMLRTFAHGISGGLRTLESYMIISFREERRNII